MKYYGSTKEKVEKLLHSDLNSGLSEKEAKKRLWKYGKNEIFSYEKKQPSKVALRLLYDPMSILLLLVSLISFSAFPVSYAILILSVWALNLLFTVVSYYKAEKIFYSLKSYGIPKMNVLREGKVYMLDSRLLVPGDIVLVEAGDIICADCKIIYSNGLCVYEKDVCGAELATSKYESDDIDAVHLSDMHGMLFASSSVISGSGICIVTACSYNTEIVANAGLIPINEKEYPELFYSIKTKCRKWSMLIIFIAFIMFIIKLFLSRGGIFDAFVLLISLIAASMTEALLPLTQVLSARAMANSAQTGQGNRVIIKHSGALENLKNIDFLLATEEIIKYENMDLFSRIRDKKIKVLICADKSNALAVATKYGAPVFKSFEEINLNMLSFGIYITDDAEDALALLKALKNKGYTIGALTTKLQYIRILDCSDIAFTYGRFKYKTGEYSRLHLEQIRENSNQILCRVSDVICEKSLFCAFRAVNCAKGIYKAVSNAASYLVTMQSVRVLLCIISLFAGVSCTTYTQLLFGGMILDLLTVFSFGFLSERAFITEKRKGIIDYSITMCDALILSFAVVFCSVLVRFLVPESFIVDAPSVSFVIMACFPLVYIFFNTRKRLKNNSFYIICLLFLIILLLCIFVSVFSILSQVMSFKLCLNTLILAVVGILLVFGLLKLRRYFFENRR